MNKDTQVNRLKQMIAFLMEEKGEAIPDLSQKSEKDLEEIWRGLVNIRPASQAGYALFRVRRGVFKAISYRGNCRNRKLPRYK